MIGRILAGLLIWLLSAQLALAAVSITFVTTDNTSLTTGFSTTPQTVTSVPIGTAAADRIVVVPVSDTDINGNDCRTSGLTIAGVSATQTAAITTSLGGNSASSIFYLLVTSGTTANFVFSYTCTSGTGNLTNQYTSFSVYTLSGADTSTPLSANATASGGTGSGVSTVSNSITIPSGGALVANSANLTLSSTTNTWTNATNSVSYSFTASFFQGNVSIGTSTTSGTPTITATWGVASATDGPVLSLASFKAAGAGGATSDQSLPLTGFGN